MHFPSAFLLAAALATSNALNILVGNDDGFGSANIREFYRLLKAAGHDAWIVAPIDNESGQGGRAVFTTEAKLTKPTEYDLVPAGAPSFGTDPHDSHIWYYNGTPAACTFFALDYVVPKFTGWKKVDLFVSGPNFGLNAGPFFYTLSGTIGATYAAVERGIPGIAYSDATAEQRSYTYINKTTPTGYPDRATIYAQASVDLVQQVIAGASNKSQLLPYGYGISVNYPFVTSFTNTSCVKPKFIQTRMTGGAQVDKAVFNETSKLFTFGNTDGPGLNTCINGDCSLPGETTVVNGPNCESSVSVFTVDYDAPSTKATAAVREGLCPLVEYEKHKVKREDAEERMRKGRYFHE
ncbi:uncharacterized protein KY384_003357 [Bacidia gigantensis]|uniref:uncharacterized protein n=1 Tax=Bacidia gigantensis TaxID=2732470 RepID=UPI001D03B71D|nr:uncharacterized protein KY384_003357 [Bacidia gigantensis]KAG8531725.1 hypothetical protein KY384_003357 [Bacidia gigantensis]